MMEVLFVVLEITNGFKRRVLQSYSRTINELHYSIDANSLK